MRKIVEKLIGEKDSFYRKDELEAVLNDVIVKIEEKSADGSYIFRGEPKCYDEVSSSLHRVRYKYADYLNEFSDDVDLISIEETLVEFARLHHMNAADKVTDEKVLDEMQHLGGETNRIDFTTSYEVALFFACNDFYNKDGRILLKKCCKVGEENLRKPTTPPSQIEAQKSIFIIEPRGVIEPDHTITIPSGLKLAVLKCLLRLSPPISIFTMYCETFGFVKFKEKYKDIYFKHMRAFLPVRASLLANSKRPEEIRKSIKKYKKLIKRMPFIPNFYRQCGAYHAMLKKTDKAIEYFKEARSWSPFNYDFLICLGMAYLDKADALANTDKNKYTNLAMTCFDRVPKKDRNYDWYMHRGKAQINRANYKLASCDFKEAIRIIQLELDEMQSSANVIIAKALYLRSASFSRAHTAISEEI